MSQTSRLLQYLSKPGRSITIFSSFTKFGITSLHRRIFELRQAGQIIRSEWVHKGKKSWKKYYLA